MDRVNLPKWTSPVDPNRGPLKILFLPKFFFQGSTIRVHKTGPFRQIDLVHKGKSTHLLFPLFMIGLRKIVVSDNDL